MLIEASTILNLLPSTSLHSTPTSAVPTPKRLLRKKSSASKANLSMCRVLNNRWAASLVKSLNPHCVSMLLMPSSIVMTCLKTKEMNFLYHFLYTLASSSPMRLEPATIASPLFCFSNSLNLLQTLSSSEKVVAPSASTINAYFPLANAIPALTAPPFPLFFGYYTTTKLRLSFSACQSATQLVLSLLPSLTTMIQCLVLCDLIQAATSLSMLGSLYYSLQDGTTSEISGYGSFSVADVYSAMFFFSRSGRVIEMGSY